MRRFVSLAMIGLLSAAVAGCEASGGVGEDDDVDVDVDRTESTYQRKTTVRDSDGDVQTKTEIRKDVND